MLFCSRITKLGKLSNLTLKEHLIPLELGLLFFDIDTYNFL